MILKDDVYGEEKIQESVLINLINSKPVQRLKKISQFGIPKEYYHKETFSRFEHSIGVLILLRRLGANLEVECHEARLASGSHCHLVYNYLELFENYLFHLHPEVTLTVRTCHPYLNWYFYKSIYVKGLVWPQESDLKKTASLLFHTDPYHQSC